MKWSPELGADRVARPGWVGHAAELDRVERVATCRDGRVDEEHVGELGLDLVEPGDDRGPLVAPVMPQGRRFVAAALNGPPVLVVTGIDARNWCAPLTGGCVASSASSRSASPTSSLVISAWVAR